MQVVNLISHLLLSTDAEGGKCMFSVIQGQMRCCLSGEHGQEEGHMPPNLLLGDCSGKQFDSFL